MTSEQPPVATFEFPPAGLDAVLEFLKRTRSELRMLRKVRVWPEKLEIFDINGDRFEVTGLGYRTPEITAVLDKLNTNFKRETIHDESTGPYKEFKTGRRYAWAQDRVM